jgi:hypothetical protein
MANILGNEPTLKAPPQSSAPQNTSVGGGSRPTVSKFKTAVSSPEDARSLGGRETPGALGMGMGRSKDQGER